MPIFIIYIALLLIFNPFIRSLSIIGIILIIFVFGLYIFGFIIFYYDKYIAHRIKKLSLKVYYYMIYGKFLLSQKFTYYFFLSVLKNYIVSIMERIRKYFQK